MIALIKNCAICGTTFRSCPAHKRKYCSYECYWSSLKGKPAHNRISNQPNRCERCDGEFRLPPSQSVVARFCSRRCKAEWMSEFIRGQRHPNWQGGKSYEPYPAGFHKLLKKKIKERDGFTCQGCGVTESEYRASIKCYLGIHHIDYDKSNLSHDNLITTCLGCNSRANWSRGFWPIRYRLRLSFADWGRTHLPAAFSYLPTG